MQSSFMPRAIKSVFTAAIFLGVFFVAPRFAAAATPVSGLIDSDTTWTAAQSPYVVASDGVTVNSGVTLTIEPGAVIKLDQSATLDSGQGTLVANGTAGSPIIFTSLKDDSVQGDTNSDGSATTPAMADWNAIVLNHPRDQVSYAHIYYGNN